MRAKKRKSKFVSKDGLPVIKKATWQKTVLDIRPDDSRTCCEDVTSWAGIVLKDTEDNPIKECSSCYDTFSQEIL